MIINYLNEYNISIVLKKNVLIKTSEYKVYQIYSTSLECRISVLLDIEDATL